MVHALRNGDLLSAFYLLFMIELIIVNQFYPGESVNILDNLFKQKPIWIYIIDIACNATLTILAALLALSTAIRSKTREPISTVGKIKTTVKWFNDNEVSMFFGLIFTIYLGILAILNLKLHWFYVFLASFYIGTALIRFINYLWHKSIVRKCGGNKIRENRYSSFILLFNAIAYFLLSGVISAAAILLMVLEGDAGRNIFLFLFIIIPFAFLRLMNAGREIRASKVNNDTYKLGVGYISLVSAFFSLLEIIAIASYYTNKIFKYTAVIIGVTILQIVVLIICITFVVHFIRSLIVNRKSRER